MASSKNRNTPAVDTATGTGTSTGAETVAPKPKSNRGGRPAGPVFGWDGQRDQVLALTLLQNPGVLTPQQLVGHLAQHPAYAADASLLTAEKIRQRVAKLNAKAEKDGYGESRFRLRRTSNSGYDMGDTLASVFKSLGMAPQPQPQQASTTGHVHEVQVLAAAATPEIQYVQPTPTGGSGSGGLIPIAGTGAGNSGLIPTPGQ